LKNIGIKVEKYNPDNNLKCIVKVIDFWFGNVNQDDDEIKKQAEELLRNKFEKVVKHPLTSITAVVRRKEKQAEREAETLVTGILEFSDLDKTIESYEDMRKSVANEEKWKVILYFHQD